VNVMRLALREPSKLVKIVRNALKHFAKNATLLITVLNVKNLSSSMMVSVMMNVTREKSMLMELVYLARSICVTNVIRTMLRLVLIVIH
jgi:hypothetical protein